MLKDKIDNLNKYYSLDDNLRLFSSDKLSDVTSDMESFLVDRAHSMLFVVENGKASFATSWRENELNREVTGVMTAENEEFVLYLPGEPYILRKCSDDVLVSVWRG